MYNYVIVPCFNEDMFARFVEKTTFEAYRQDLICGNCGAAILSAKSVRQINLNEHFFVIFFLNL